MMEKRRGSDGKGSQRDMKETGQTRRTTMKKHYEGLPAAGNIQESIIQAQRQILIDLDRRKQSAAAVQRLIDSVTRLAA